MFIDSANVLKCLHQDSGFPCFKGGPRTIQNLRKRFHLGLTEEVSELSFFNSVVIAMMIGVTNLAGSFVSFLFVSALCVLGTFPN